MDIAKLDIAQMKERSRLSVGDQEKILTILLRSGETGVSMQKMSEETGIAYASVRMAYGYLGVVSVVGVAGGSARALDKAERLRKIRAELRKNPDSTALAIANRLGLAYHMVQPLMKEAGLSRVVEIQHGTAVGYGYWKCRCDECVLANRKRCYAVKEDMQSRPEDIPHGTMTAYWNWACRCEECRVVGSRVNKERVFTEPEARGRVGLRWTPEEDAVVAGDESARSIALRLGRSVSSVNTRRATLKRQAA